MLHLASGCGDGVCKQVMGDRADQVRRRREQVAVSLRCCPDGSLRTIELLMNGAAGGGTTMSAYISLRIIELLMNGAAGSGTTMSAYILRA